MNLGYFICVTNITIMLQIVICIRRIHQEEFFLLNLQPKCNNYFR